MTNTGTLEKTGRSRSDKIIITHELTKKFPNILAVDHLDLGVYRGEIFGLLGPNGAGKTTTVGMLNTLVIPTSGRASLAGIDITSNPALVKQLIGVVAQSNNLDRSLNVWENLYYHGLFFGMSSKESRRAADVSLERFQLSDRAKSDVMEISGGMAKRLQVARALIHNPSVLFLDEPTAGLDPQSRLALWDILDGMHREGQTIFLTTHYMEEADSVCSRIGIMDHGKIIALGTSKELKESVGADTIVTISTTGDPGKLARLLEKRVEGATGSQVVDNTLQLHIKGTKGVLPIIVTESEKAGFNITDLSVSEPTLENVFIRLTGRRLRE